MRTIWGGLIWAGPPCPAWPAGFMSPMMKRRKKNTPAAGAFPVSGATRAVAGCATVNPPPPPHGRLAAAARLSPVPLPKPNVPDAYPLQSARAPPHRQSPCHFQPSTFYLITCPLPTQPIPKRLPGRSPAIVARRRRWRTGRITVGRPAAPQAVDALLQRRVGGEQVLQAFAG